MLFGERSAGCSDPGGRSAVRLCVFPESGRQNAAGSIFPRHRNFSRPQCRRVSLTLCSYRALDAFCFHGGGPLGTHGDIEELDGRMLLRLVAGCNELRDGTLSCRYLYLAGRCPWHYRAIDLSSGQEVGEPSQASLRSRSQRTTHCTLRTTCMCPHAAPNRDVHVGPC